MLRQFCRKNGTLNICRRTAFVLSTVGVVAFGTAMLGTGYYLGTREAALSPPDEGEAAALAAAVAGIGAWVEQERGQIDRVRQETEDHLDALAMRLASLQAEMMRVGAVGERLVRLADLDSGEFDFSQSPAVGGPDDPEAGKTQSASDLIAGMDALAKVLHERGEQLSVLEEWLMTNEVRRQTLPSGLPVLAGWVSSDFGSRINPVTGKRQRHDGVDIPGDVGEDVMAVAAGVVTRSDRMSGYGNIVEIRHADGYTTLYAHNQANLVKEGDRVEKGQVIAFLGRSGRTTGPHVHFEVRKDGKPVDPAGFIASDG